jgi:hypothetical protein
MTMANTPKVNRDAGFERAAKVKRIAGRGRISKMKLPTRGAYDGTPAGSQSVQPRFRKSAERKTQYR